MVENSGVGQVTMSQRLYCNITIFHENVGSILHTCVFRTRESFSTLCAAAARLSVAII